MKSKLHLKQKSAGNWANTVAITGFAWSMRPNKAGFRGR